MFKSMTNGAETFSHQSRRISLFDTGYPLEYSNRFEVYSACLGKLITKQTAGADQAVKGRNRNADIADRTLFFGNDIYPVQFIIGIIT